MKKIKLVISDLHLGKGRYLPEGGTNTLEEFFYSEKLVEFFNYYSSEAFREYEIELIINGDFLNFLQCDYRGFFLSVLTESVCLSILKEIIEGHKKVFEAIRFFCSNPNHTITYVVGNHDQAMLWPATRELLNHVVGTSIRYKNLVYFFDGVHIEHGHMREAANRFETKKFFLRKDLVEPILNLPFGSHFFIEVVLKIKQKYPYVDKIRPFNKMVQWVALNETRVFIKSIFKLIGFFIEAVWRKDPRKNWSARKLMQIVYESAVFPDLSTAAQKILEDSNVNTVIFGHSHVYQYRQFSKNKEYFNTGTWTEITSLDITSLGKITKLTYVLLEYIDSDPKPRGKLKEWRGYHRIEEDVAVS